MNELGIKPKWPGSTVHLFYPCTILGINLAEGAQLIHDEISQTQSSYTFFHYSMGRKHFWAIQFNLMQLKIFTDYLVYISCDKCWRHTNIYMHVYAHTHTCSHTPPSVRSSLSWWKRYPVGIIVVSSKSGCLWHWLSERCQEAIRK